MANILRFQDETFIVLSDKRFVLSVSYREIFEHYDDKYLKHWFQRDPERKDEELLEFYEKIFLEQV